MVISCCEKHVFLNIYKSVKCKHGNNTCIFRTGAYAFYTDGEFFKGRARLRFYDYQLLCMYESIAVFVLKAASR